MKFSTVEIKERATKQGVFVVSFSDMEGDRHNEDFGPNALGFYHYPRSKGKIKAFEELRAHMVKCHEQTITALTQRVNKLKALELK